MAKMLYRKDTGEILGVHIIGLHAADLIHEASNAIATKQTVQVRRGASARGRVCVCVVGEGGGGQAGSPVLSMAKSDCAVSGITDPYVGCRLGVCGSRRENTQGYCAACTPVC